MGSQHSATDARPTGRAARDHFFRYLPQDPSAPLDAERVIGIGRATVTHGQEYPPRDHPQLYSFDWRTGRTLPEHQVILLTDANGEFESRSAGRIRLLGDVILFLFPGEWHRYRPHTGGGWQERWISLQGRTVADRLAKAKLTPFTPMAPQKQPRLLVEAFDAVVRLVGVSCNAGGDATPLGMQVLDEAIRQATDVQLAEESIAPQRQEEVRDEIVRQALEFIWNHQHNPPLAVSDVARQLPVTRRTLDRRFADVLGHSVLDEINACRLSRAKRLLADTDVPVKAVAYLAGFPSRERLRLAFLNNEGIPPSEYREVVRQRRAGDT